MNLKKNDPPPKRTIGLFLSSLKKIEEREKRKNTARRRDFDGMRLFPRYKYYDQTTREILWLLK